MNRKLALQTPVGAMQAWIIQCLWVLIGWCCATSAMAVPITLTIGMEEANNWPFERQDAQGDLDGFHVAMIRAVAQQLGWHVHFKRFPWQRAIAKLRRDELQAVSFVAKSPEREEFAVFLPDNILHISRPSLFIRRDRANEIRFEPPLHTMMQRWRFGAAQGYYYNDEVVALIQAGVPVDQGATTQTQLFRMLERARFDVAFGAANALIRAEIEIPGIQQQLQELDGVVLDGKAMYLAFSRASGTRLAQDFASAYRRLRHTPRYMELAARYGVQNLLPTQRELH